MREYIFDEERINYPEDLLDDELVGEDLEEEEEDDEEPNESEDEL